MNSQVSIHEVDKKSHALLVLKGAPEKVLEMCSTIFVRGKEIPLTEDLRQEINRVSSIMQTVPKKLVRWISE